MEIYQFFGRYLISNKGRALSLNYGRIREMKLDINDKGYSRVTFCENNRTKKHLVHRLIAKTFLPNPENKRTVNHKDGNPRNNDINNLEWATHSENHLHAFKYLGKKANKTMLGRTNEMSKKSKPVIQIDKNGEIVRAFPSINEAERITGTCARNISSVCLGKLKTANNFKWRFANV